MNKFNLPRRNIQKERRAKRAEKRRLRSSAATSKVSNVVPPRTVSGKKQRKLQKKWRKTQKEALQSGLLTIQDIEMMAVDEEGGEGQGSSHRRSIKTTNGFHIKKRAKLRIKGSSHVKGKQVSEVMDLPPTDAEGDAMIQ